MTSLSLSRVREEIRDGRWSTTTRGLAPGYAQANVIILPAADAADFLLFCVRNPRACPLIEVLDPGSPVPRQSAPEADIRTDLPRYRIYKGGELSETAFDIAGHWRDDLVTFLLGCSFTLDSVLAGAGIRLRDFEEMRSDAMYRTSIPCEPAGKFSGPLVVSLRPLTATDAIRAIAITSRFPSAHGEPVHIGDPQEIGITDLAHPDYGEIPDLEPGEIPVFWACGVTPQAVAVASKPELMITHEPGCMFLTSLQLGDVSIRDGRPHDRPSNS